MPNPTPRRPVPGRTSTPARTTKPARPPSESPARGPTKKFPVVPVAISAVALIGIVAVVLLMKGRGEEAPASATSTASTASPAAPTPDGTAPADPNAPAASAAPAAAPKLDAKVVHERLEAITTANAALLLGDEVLRETQDRPLAETCFERALAIDPQNEMAKQKLGVRPISPSDDFPGLDDIQGSPQTYMLAEFLALRGKVMKRSERDQVVLRWNEHRKLVEARVAEADGDPFLQRVDRARNQMANTPFYDTLKFDVIESTRPYALFVEVKGESVTDQDVRRAAVEEAYAPFLAAYDESIHDYLWKLSPAPPKTEPTFIVFILLDRGSYDRFFLEAEKTAAPPGVRAHYNPRTNWAYTYSPEVDDPKDPDFAEGTQVLLHELTHAWVDQLATADGGRTYDIEIVGTHWFGEGIAEFMSCHFLDGDQIRFQPWRSMRLAEAGERPPGVRIPLKRAFLISSSGELAANAAMVARDPEVRKSVSEGAATGIAMSGFYADMSLFIFWLNYGNGGKHKRKFEDYVRKELSGDGGGELSERVFAEVFALPDLEKTIDEFQQAVISKKLAFTDQKLSIER